jgi:D-hydroxyproline dehydrogenase subunit gamma
MHENIAIRLNGKQVTVLAGTSVAASLLSAGETCRTSVTGHPRGPLCGMGICFECRVTINGKRHARGCQVQCEAGMDISCDD